jgi:hypothetical protein
VPAELHMIRKQWLYVVVCLLCGGLVCTAMEELPDDDTHVSKHVVAAEWNNKLLKISASVGYL